MFVVQVGLALLVPKAGVMLMELLPVAKALEQDCLQVLPLAPELELKLLLKPLKFVPSVLCALSSVSEQRGLEDSALE